MTTLPLSKSKFSLRCKTRIRTVVGSAVIFFALGCSSTVIAQGQTAKDAGAALRQTNAYLKARCAQLTSYYDYYAARGSFESDGYRNHTRIRALMDCERGHYEAGIKAMEALMARKHMSVPRPDVASTPDGRVAPINTALIPSNLLEQRQQASTPSNDAATPSNDAAYCATLSKIYRKTAPQHKTSSVTVPVATAKCDAGDTAAGIPVLEQALKNEGMTLPQR